MTRAILHSLATLALFAFSGASASETDAVKTGGASSLFGLEASRLDGTVESLDRYRGQVVLVVNTASRCGYTPQYEGLQALFERYRGQGFSVLGFPSNDFAGQEPGTNPEIGAFCKSSYGVGFPMFSKVQVKGANAHPVYLYLTSLPKPIGGPVEWNFQKYLVDRNGKVVARYAPRVSPTDPGLVAEIERLLAQAASNPPSARLAR